MKHLYNQWYIGSDKYNIILYERTINTKGKNKGSEKFDAVSFHTNVKSLRKRLLIQYTIDNIANLEMDLFLKELQEIEKRIREEFKL